MTSQTDVMLVKWQHLIVAGHFPPKSPIISGSFVEDLRIKQSKVAIPISRKVKRQRSHHIHMYIYVYISVYICIYICIYKVGGNTFFCKGNSNVATLLPTKHHKVNQMSGSRIVSTKYQVVTKLSVSFAKEPYKRDDILQKRHIILRSLLIMATP